MSNIYYAYLTFCKEIENIVDAITAGMFHAAMKDKMDELEAQQLRLVQLIEEAKLQAEIHTPNLNMIKAYISKDSNLKNKTLEEQKSIIQAYVKKIIVFPDTIEIENIVDLSGCGGLYKFKSTIKRK